MWQLKFNSSWELSRSTGLPVQAHLNWSWWPVQAHLNWNWWPVQFIWIGARYCVYTIFSSSPITSSNEWQVKKSQWCANSNTWGSRGQANCHWNRQLIDAWAIYRDLLESLDGCDSKELRPQSCYDNVFSHTPSHILHGYFPFFLSYQNTARDFATKISRLSPSDASLPLCLR